MDVSYNPDELIHLQMQVIVCGVIGMCILGLIWKKRASWLLSTIAWWFCLLIYYVTHHPIGYPMN